MSLNNKKIFGAACLDISKAFDCINHKLLLAKLVKFGLSNGSINWFKSYLDRTQQLTYNGSTSKTISVNSGIGQGTIIETIIFLIYINDIVLTLPDVHINMYADDCILYSTGNTWDQVFNRVRVALTIFDNWCLRNRMVLNAAKSKCLIIGRRTKLSRIDYYTKLAVRGISLDYVKKKMLFSYLP